MVFRRFVCLKTVFAVGDAAKVRFGVPNWLWERGFAWLVAAVGGRSVGFIGCGIGFCCHVLAVSGWERGFAWCVCFVFGRKKEGRLTTFP